MKKLISANIAGRLLILLLILLAIFHVLMLMNVVSSDIAWGGQAADSPQSMLLLEILALSVTILFILVVLIRLRQLRVKKPSNAIKVCVWIIFAYFILNTAANVASSVSIENLIFAPLTVLLALLALRLAVE